MRQATRITGIWLALIALLIGIRETGSEASLNRIEAPLVDEIRARGVLRFAVADGGLSHFEFRGERVGFEHDLLARFAEGLGVELEIIPQPSGSKALAALKSTEADVALLPWSEKTTAGIALVAPYLRGSEGSGLAYPESGALHVRSSSPRLLVHLNRFLADERSVGALASLHERYFDNYRRYRMMELPARHRISPYDQVIARHAQDVGFDWRLVAAVIHVESTFRPDAESPKGALGLMQLMPSHADGRPDLDLRDPDVNVRTGVRYLKTLANRFPEATGEDRIALALAAYLLGPGHVFDARILAERHGLDPNRWWGGLEQVVPLLEHEETYRDLKHGYAQGVHAVEYVRRVFLRYRDYGDQPPTLPIETARTGDESTPLVDARSLAG